MSRTQRRKINSHHVISFTLAEKTRIIPLGEKKLANQRRDDLFFKKATFSGPSGSKWRFGLFSLKDNFFSG